MGPVESKKMLPQAPFVYKNSRVTNLTILLNKPFQCHGKWSIVDLN